jgi:hypothetical protein
MKTVAVSVPIVAPSDNVEAGYARLKYKTSSETLQITSIAIPKRTTSTSSAGAKSTSSSPPAIPAGAIVEVKAIVQGPQDEIPRVFTVACFPLSSSSSASPADSVAKPATQRKATEEAVPTLQTENMVFLTDLRFVMESVHISATLLVPAGFSDAALKTALQEWSSLTVFGTATPLV